MDQDLVKALGFHTDKQPKLELERFFVNLAVCNTVVPSTDEDGNLKYQVCQVVFRYPAWAAMVHWDPWWDKKGHVSK
jgi:hypothetical protein